MALEPRNWTRLERPGYFGRKRDEKIAKLNFEHGFGNWRLVWDYFGMSYDFFTACRVLYEASYIQWLEENPKEIDFICTFGECIDNAPTNVQSGLDYMKQESFSTHIQDIAVRNALRMLGRWFEGPADKILVIRSSDSNGFKYGPGNVPFFLRERIITPSLCPKWASAGSVEDFWQSNKWIEVRASKEDDDE